MNPWVDPSDREVGPRSPSRSTGVVRLPAWLIPALALLLGLLPWAAQAQAPAVQGGSLPPLTLNIGLDGVGQPKDVDIAIQVLFAITLLSLAPSIVLLMTCFSRIVIVLSFVRNALTLQGAPANQVIIGLSLFLTYFVMEPVWSKIQTNALQPYMEKRISSSQALDEASKPIRSFMLRQTRPADVELFVELAKIPATSPENMPLRVVIPAFIISELRTAFQMGFLIFVPFILIDIVVATVLMSMGMMMMPPATIALPLKILLFVLVDGWSLIVRSLLLSFGI
jgi:flagellar biosynthetic protein FliP